MPSGTRWVAIAIAGFSLVGCANNDLLVKRQTEAEAKIELLLQGNKKAEQRLNELSSYGQTQADLVKGLKAEVSQLQLGIKELKQVQDDLKTRLTLLAQQAPKVEVVNPEPASAKESGPPPEYVQAFGLYSANNFVAAIQAFNTFIKNNPQSEFVANAFYWIGECHYSQSDLEKAQEAFRKVIDTYPKSNKAADAMLKLGYSQLAMKEKKQAIATFENLIKLYPGSSAAAKARERLTANLQ